MTARKVHYVQDENPICLSKRWPDPVVTVNQDLVTCAKCRELMPPKPEL